ncbi:MAG: hypothetical protein R3F59_39055, partial [Myxococcota bacterium]
MADIDVTRYGFRLPAALPPVDTGDPKLDAAFAQVEKKAASLAKKGEFGTIKPPARLASPKPGDLQHVLAVLTPEAFDVGHSIYDLSRPHDDRKEYLAAWRACILPRETRQSYVAALVGIALLDPEGEAAVRPLLPLAMTTNGFAKVMIDALLACPRPLAPETLRTGLAALDLD